MLVFTVLPSIQSVEWCCLYLQWVFPSQLSHPLRWPLRHFQSFSPRWFWNLPSSHARHSPLHPCWPLPKIFSRFLSEMRKGCYIPPLSSRNTLSCFNRVNKSITAVVYLFEIILYVTIRHTAWLSCREICHRIMVLPSTTSEDAVLLFPRLNFSFAERKCWPWSTWGQCGRHWDSTWVGRLNYYHWW